MDRSVNRNHLPQGTPHGAQGLHHPGPVRRYATDWSEPSYLNNKMGNEIFGLKRLCSNSCQICPMLNVDSSVVISTVNKRKYPILTNQDLSCKTKNLVYVLTCRVCSVQYVGETEQTLGARMNGHKTGIRQGLSEEYKHFRSDHAHNDILVKDRFTIQVAEKIYDDDLDVDDPTYRSKMKTRRVERELAWTCRLQTFYPLGLNTKIKGVGMANDCTKCKPFNIFTLSSSYDLRIKKRNYSSKTGRSRNIGTVDDLRSFLTSLKDKSIASCIGEIRQRKIRFLRRCTVIDRFKELSLDKQKLILDWINYAKNNNLPNNQRTNKNRKRLYLEINFIHKDIQTINLRRIFNEAGVRKMIPARCKFKEMPIIYFKYCKNILQSILNYNAATKESSFESFEDIQNIVCQCDEEDVAAFVDPIHGHVLTGDLNIVQNLELRDAMSKGAKFREVPRLSRMQIEASLLQDLDRFKEKWCEKERFENELDPWISLIKQKIKVKLDNMPDIGKGRLVLEKPEVKTELNRLKSRYIITVVDKAANNFAFQCQKFYFLRAATELGVNNLQGNSTYAVVGDKNNIALNIRTEMEQKFRIETNVQDFPVIFWQPKFHKDPVKFRGIAGSRNKILSPLEKVVGRMMKHLSNHFQNYCGTAERLTSFRHFFVIKNSGGILDSLQKLKGNAVTFDSFDFSDLYTNFRHGEILERLNWLIDLMFHNAGKRYLSLQKLFKS